MKFTALMFTLAISFTGLTARAETITLSQALQTADSQSPQLSQSQAAHAESEWKKVESYSGFLPKLTGTASYFPTYKYMFLDVTLPGSSTVIDFPSIVPTTIYTLNAEYNLFDGLASTNRLREMSWQEQAAAESLNWTRFRTEREVILQFYRALSARILKQVAESNLNTLEDHHHDVMLLKKSGLSTNYDVLRVEVQVSEANSEVLNSADNAENAVGHLAELLGKDTVAEPMGQLPEPTAAVVNQLEANKDKIQRADLVAMADQVEALNARRRGADSHWFPSLSLVGQYNYYDNINDRLNDFSSFRNSYEFGLSLSWKLFDGFADVAKYRQTVEERTQLEKSRMMAQLKASQDIALWKRKYKYYLSVYQARQSDIGKSKEAVRLAKEGRHVGSRTNTDLLDAETDLFRAQAGAVNAQMGVIESLINLELATGQKLYDFN